MSFLDTPDLKSGFWLGLGLLAAFAVWAFVQLLMMRAAGKTRNG